MPDVQALVNDFVLKLQRRYLLLRRFPILTIFDELWWFVSCVFPCFILSSKIEGSHASARQTAELLRTVVSQQRMPQTNQAAALIDAVKAVGERLIAANHVGRYLIIYYCCCWEKFSCAGVKNYALMIVKSASLWALALVVTLGNFATFDLRGIHCLWWKNSGIGSVNWAGFWEVWQIVTSL